MTLTPEGLHLIWAWGLHNGIFAFLFVWGVDLWSGCKLARIQKRFRWGMFWSGFRKLHWLLWLMVLQLIANEDIAMLGPYPLSFLQSIPLKDVAPSAWQNLEGLGWKIRPWLNLPSKKSPFTEER